MDDETKHVMSAIVPFQPIGNRKFLSGLQLVTHPWLRDFVERYPNCFEPSAYGDFFEYFPDGDAPHTRS